MSERIDTILTQLDDLAKQEANISARVTGINAISDETKKKLDGILETIKGIKIIFFQKLKDVEQYIRQLNETNDELTRLKGKQLSIEDLNAQMNKLEVEKNQMVNEMNSQSGSLQKSEEEKKEKVEEPIVQAPVVYKKETAQEQLDWLTISDRDI